ncbi:GGDEF domain-containing protein [Aquincola sp. MAHUQ-54]|uniref:GGDEF domain-containing protein n=1 Tax=Aquincola agrisoli TaxID=3119538 RepID=A0AAW9Q8D6_9BURK
MQYVDPPQASGGRFGRFARGRQRFVCCAAAVLAVLAAAGAGLGGLMLAGGRHHAADLGLLAWAAVHVAATALALAWWTRQSRRWIEAGLAAEASAEALSLSDALTQVANPRGLELHLNRMLLTARRAGRPLALLALDIDGLAAVNEEHGHAAGDELLQLCARRLYAHVRDIDIVARVGGDEFVIVLEAPESLPAAVAVGQRMLATLAQPVRLLQAHQGGAPRVEVSASLGLAVYPEHAQAAEPLLAQAEQALRQAKRQGGNRLCVACVAPRPADSPLSAAATRATA